MNTGASERPLRVALLYTPLAQWGGAERQACEELRGLRRLGVDATLLTFGFDPSCIPTSIDRTAIEVLPGDGRLSRARALRSRLRRGDLDVLVAHSSMELAWLSLLGLRLGFVAYRNDPPWYEYAAGASPPWRYRRAFGSSIRRFPPAGARTGVRAQLATELRHLLRLRAQRAADAVVVLSESHRRQLADMHGIEAIVVRGCVDGMEASGPSDRAPVVLTISRLVPVKAIDVAVRAFALARQDVPSAHLVVVGDGPEVDALTEIARRCGLNGSVTFTGQVADEELREHLCTASVFVAPSRADYNIAPYEALAHGCRVVWTPEMQPEPELESRGWIHVAEPQDEEFASAIVRALLTETRGRPELGEMTWEARNRSLLRLLRTVAAAKERPER